MKVQMVKLEKNVTYLVQVPDDATEDELEEMMDVFMRYEIRVIIMPASLIGDMTKVDEGRIIEFTRPYLKDIVKAIEELVE